MTGTDTIVEIEGFDSGDGELTRSFDWLRSVAGHLAGHVRKPVLRIGELKLKAGCAYAVIGKSGAGKTVLNSFLMGFPAFYCSRMAQLSKCRWWEGVTRRSTVKISKWNYRFPRDRQRKWMEIRRKGVLLYLPQMLPDGRGYEMTTREYVRQVERALLNECRGVEDSQGWLSDFPDELRGRLKVPLDKLSGGERRRVELWVRLHVLGCVGNRPGLLILDEPTTGLDVPDERKYMQDLKERLVKSKNVAVLVTTHALHLLDAEIFSGVVVVHKTCGKDGSRDVCEVSSAAENKRLSAMIHEEFKDKSSEAWSRFLAFQAECEFSKVMAMYFRQMEKQNV